MQAPIQRLAGEDDFDALGEVMFDAVRNGKSPYSEIQRQAWVPAPRNGPAWRARLADQTIFAETQTGAVSGFMSLRADGYIDFAYIRPAARGAGMFRRLYDSIEREALRRKLARLFTHASLMAQPAFAAMGFSVIRPETVELGGQWFDRFVMEKMIGQSAGREI